LVEGGVAMNAKQYGSLAILILIASFLGGAVSARIFNTETAYARRGAEIPKVVRAEMFQVVDANGDTRAVLYEGGLRLQEKAEKRFVLMDKQGLLVGGTDSPPRVSLQLGPQGDASLFLADKRGLRRIGLSVLLDGHSSVKLSDEDGDVIWEAP
jgi:hypothetical protein